MARIGFLSHADMSKQSNDTNCRCDFANNLERISAKFFKKG
ncbi:hypothetical protein [Campylobacter mucosalis]|nr:hypothetical protein [Campylobacter mucosalis]